MDQHKIEVTKVDVYPFKEGINSQERVIRHQKYKRCLAMAKLCNARWILDYHLYKLDNTSFYERWEKRWIRIAEQFKEAR